MTFDSVKEYEDWKAAEAKKKAPAKKPAAKPAADK